jgi:hypothetical protein
MARVSSSYFENAAVFDAALAWRVHPEQQPLRNHQLHV